MSIALSSLPPPTLASDAARRTAATTTAAGPLIRIAGLEKAYRSRDGSRTRALGPVMVAIILAGRVGSAMAAEIGSMRVYQELDALRTMNINPVHYLVLPRLVAISIALPVLVLFSILVGWFGGGVVAVMNDRTKR